MVATHYLGGRVEKMRKKEKTILVVDDDKNIIKSIKDILELEGYNVGAAETGKEAIKKTVKTYYNLVLLDIRLPDMEGTELLTKMHQHNSKTVNIMITGYPSLNNAIESLNLGADAYLMKPIDPKKLLKIVEEKLKKQEENDRMTGVNVKEWIESRLEKREEHIRSLATELQNIYEKTQEKQKRRQMQKNS